MTTDKVDEFTIEDVARWFDVSPEQLGCTEDYQREVAAFRERSERRLAEACRMAGEWAEKHLHGLVEKMRNDPQRSPDTPTDSEENAMAAWLIEPHDNGYKVISADGPLQGQCLMALGRPSDANCHDAFEAAARMVRMLPELHELYIKVVRAAHLRANVNEAEEYAVEAQQACTLAVDRVLAFKPDGTLGSKDSPTDG